MSLELLASDKAITARELSNLLWSLGKLSVSLADEPMAQTVVLKLLDRLNRAIRYLSPFDFESIMVGLGLL